MTAGECHIFFAENVEDESKGEHDDLCVVGGNETVDAAYRLKLRVERDPIVIDQVQQLNSNDRKNYIVRDIHSLKEKLQRICDNHSKEAGFLVIHISSDGNSKQIALAKGETIDTREVLDYFREDKCERFKDKPKIFIFQKCLGNRVMDGVDTNGPECTDRDSYEYEALDIDLQEEINRLTSKPGYKNFFVIYPTTPGHKSHYEQSKSPFGISLQKVVHDGSHLTPAEFAIRLNKEYQAALKSNYSNRFPNTIFTISTLTDANFRL